MAANFVQVNAADNNEDGEGTTVAIASLNTGAGNLMVVSARWDGGGLNDGATGTVTDTAGNTYTLLGYAVTGNASEDSKVGLWYCLSTTANATNTITLTLNSARFFKQMFVAQYSYDNTIELGDDGTGSSTSNVTAYTTSPALGAVTGDLVVGWFANYNSNDTYTADSPFTKRSSTIYGQYIEYIVVTGTSFSPSMTVGGAGDTYAALSAVFQEAVGGGGNNYTITAESGTYNLSGQEASLLTSGALTAETGLYTLIGSNALRDIEMDAEQGSYALNGQDAALIGTAILTAERGTYTLIGQAANLLYSFAASIARPKGQRRQYGFRLNR